MGALLDGLREWGCDVDGAMERFMEDEELYVSCLNTILTDEAFTGLGSALQTGESRKAFEYAHTLKGVLANLGLTPMFDITVRIVEPLRAERDEDLIPAYGELMEARAYLASLITAAH